MRALENVWIYVDPVGPITDALAAAIEVTRQSGATLTLVGAIGRSEDPMFQASFGPRILRLVREDREARLRELALVARASLPAGRVRSTMLEGDVPWQCLALHALERSPDLLVVPARGGPDGFDPVSHHLLRTCAVPIWSVHRGGRIGASARPAA